MKSHYNDVGFYLSGESRRSCSIQLPSHPRAWKGGRARSPYLPPEGVLCLLCFLLISFSSLALAALGAPSSSTRTSLGSSSFACANILSLPPSQSFPEPGASI